MITISNPLTMQQKRSRCSWRWKTCSKGARSYSFFPSVSLDAAVSLQCHTASETEPATAWADQTCSFLCSRLRRQIQILVSFSQVIQARRLVISDLRTKCQNVKSQLQPSLPRISFLSCKTISDQADSFRHKLFNLHVTSQGRHRPSTVAVKVFLCFVTISCIDLLLSQIATTSSYFFQNPSNGKSKDFPS